MEPIQILQTVAFLDLLAAGLIMPQLPPHAKSLGCSHLSIGLMGALYAGFQLLSGPIIGTSTADTKGKIRMLIIVISLCGIAYVLLGITSSIALFLGLRAFLGFFKHTQMLTKSLNSSVEKDKTQLPGLSKKMDMISAAGLSTGPIVGGYIMEVFPNSGFSIIAFIVGIIYAVNSNLIRNLPLSEESETKEPLDEPTPIKVIDNISNSLKTSIKQFYQIDWNIYGEFFLLRILMTLCIGVYFCNFALYLRIKHQVSPANLGFVTSIVWTIGSSFDYFKNYLNSFYNDDKDFHQRNYHSFLTITLLLIAMALAPSASIYVILIVPLIISFSVGRSVTVELILNKTEGSQKGTVIGVANSLRNIIGILAPLVAGFLGEYVGIFNIVYVCIILAGVGTYRSQILIPEVVIKNAERKDQ